FAFFGGLGNVESVGAHAVADNLRHNRSAAPAGELELLENQDARAFPDYKAIAIDIKWPAGFLGSIVARRKSSHCREPAHAHGSDGRLGAAGDHYVGSAALN